jgi:hypothetical protein
MVPSSAKLKELVSEYLDDSKDISMECLKSSLGLSQFRDIYHASLSTESVLASLSNGSLRPSLSSARGVILRLPMLAAIGQTSAAKAELRRYLELVLWIIYFSDHLIEWKEFEGKSGKGFTRDPHKPISFAAHRELAHYFDYARELMEGETSGLAKQSIDNLKQANYKLNAAVHPGQLARTKGKLAPFDQPSEDSMRDFAKLQRDVCSNTCLLLAAYRVSKFNNLPAIARAHFDWLVGSALRKAVRSGPFGLK